MAAMASQPIAKRAKLESEPVCILVLTFTDPDYCIFVYYEDLKDKEKIDSTPLKPDIRISGLSVDTSAVVWKSTLYIFSPYGTYKYSLHGTEHCVDIELERCQKLALMTYDKHDPAAMLIETESGPKIILFSRTDTCHFEVYDVETDKWCLLPEPKNHSLGGNSVDYYFVDGPKCFVNMSGRSFAMDFSRIDGLEWERCFFNSMMGRYHQPILRDGDWAILPHMKLVHMFEPYHGRHVPFHSYVNMTITGWYDDFVLRLPSEGGERLRACYVQLGVCEDKTGLPHVLEFYLLKFHGNKLIPDLGFSKAFLLAAENVYDFRCILGVFPMSSSA